MVIEFDKVYETKMGNSEFEGNPSFIVDAGTVNVYVSDAQAAPTGFAQMTLTQDSPFAVGVFAVVPAVKYILFTQATGTSIVTERFLLS